MMSGKSGILADYEFTGDAGPEKRLGFLYLPFTVPEKACTIEVEYEYQGKGPGETTVDIGLFQPGTVDLITGMKNLRGWSGSNKKSFTVSREAATPSYLPGDIPPGEWKVILGLYKIPDQGLRYRVKVRVYEGCLKTSSQSLPETSELVQGDSPKGWVKGDLHMHSVHSDGDSTLDQIAEVAGSLGLDFVSVTDHNVVSHIAELGFRSRFLGKVFFLRGVELTTYRGHMNVYGVSEIPEFRIRSDEELKEVVAYLRSRGAFLSINHPKPLGPDWEFENLSFADSLEVFHSVWEFNNYVSLRKWDQLLNNGFRIGLVGGSDAHEMRGMTSILLPGTPTTWVYVDKLSEEGLLDGLRKQRVFVSESPSGPRITLEAHADGKHYPLGGIVNSKEVKLRLRAEGGRGQSYRVISGGEVVASGVLDSDVFEKVFQIHLSSPYVRAELVREAQAIDDPYHMENIISALTAPIYLKV